MWFACVAIQTHEHKYRKQDQTVYKQPKKTFIFIYYVIIIFLSFPCFFFYNIIHLEGKTRRLWTPWTHFVTSLPPRKPKKVNEKFAAFRNKNCGLSCDFFCLFLFFLFFFLRSLGLEERKAIGKPQSESLFSDS